jgi:hypothetical protein
MSRVSRAIWTIWIVSFFCLAPLSGDVTAATGDPVLINEVLASHTGTDSTEFIELIGTPGLLGGLELDRDRRRQRRRRGDDRSPH